MIFNRTKMGYSRKNFTPYIEEVHFGKDDHPGFSSFFWTTLDIFLFLFQTHLGFSVYFTNPPWIFLSFFRTLPGFFCLFSGHSLVFLPFSSDNPGFKFTLTTLDVTPLQHKV